MSHGIFIMPDCLHKAIVVIDMWSSVLDNLDSGIKDWYLYLLVIAVERFQATAACTDSMGAGAVVLCSVVLGLQLAVGSNIYTSDSGDDYGSGEWSLKLAK